jgi:4-amino-4-deoxy-L-arabinose transferase-like glycosyltransferase
MNAAAAAPLIGAAWTSLVMLSLGLLAAQALRLPLRRSEVWSIGYLLGACCLSLVIFGLAAASLLHRPILLGAGVIAVVAALWRGAWRYGLRVETARLPAGWRWALAGAAAVYGVYTFVHAWAPEASPDGLQYHLGLVQRYLRQGGFGHVTTNIYANMPMAADMLFLYAFAFGRHSAAALVHWSFLPLTAVLLVQFGKRFNVAAAGGTAALLTVLSPVVQVDGSSAYVDVALLSTLFAMFYLLLVYERESHESSRGVPAAAGALAGFAVAAKMTAGLAAPFALAYIVVTGMRLRRDAGRDAILVTAFAALVIAPWLVKSAVTVGNPVSPFANRIFPNPHVRISSEEEYRTGLRTYWGSVTDAREIPMEVTVRGHKLAGLLGPVFLLTPVALLALRWPIGRRALLACAVFLLPYPTNIGTRFLLPALPFAALAMGMVFVRWRPAAAVLLAFHAFTAWPGVMALYADPSAWRLKEFRLKQALRREPEHDFLMRISPEYRASQVIETHVPEGERVLTWGGPAQAYTSREILIPYQGAFNLQAAQTFASGTVEGYQAVREWRFRFEPVRAQRVRLVLTSGSATDEWSLSEVRLFHNGFELPRTRSWRIAARPNPWDIGFAFDGCPGTRWLSAQQAEPGMYVEVELGRPRLLSELRTAMTPDQTLSARLDIHTNGTWRTVAQAGELTSIPPLPNTRLNASDDLKRMGVRYVMTSEDDFLSDDLFRNQRAWGVTMLGETERTRLYQLD